MPLARAAMHRLGETLHVAAWPSVRETYAVASRHYAFEGRCFVLAAGTIQQRDDVLDGLERLGGHAEARVLLDQMPEQLQFGGSLIAGPDGMVIAQAGAQAELLIADLDLTRSAEERAALDTEGHYSRPDIFELRVDARPKDGVIFES